MGEVIRAREVFSGQFECQHCELDVPATVRAVGWGGGREGFSTLTPEQEAVEDAGGVASRTLQFVKCPRCGKTDPGGTSYRIQVRVGVLLIGALIFGLAYGFFRLRSEATSLDRSEQLWFAGGLAAILVAVLYWKWSRPWRGAAKRTRIHFTR